MHHRGPDDKGCWTDGSVGLGHSRLSIHDLSSAGHQPMTNEDGSIRIVFNGEIYNFEELRNTLQQAGHVFSSRTDTETIIHLYEEKGFDCLQDLKGMFAFALWDAHKDLLFLARDRIGKKPLVYAKTSDSFVFASEIQALLKDADCGNELDSEAMHHYLTYQYVPSPYSIFKSIRKVPPAHYVVVKRDGITMQRYWQLSYKQKGNRCSFDEYRERFGDIFNKAVAIRLKSDVPFGAFLSGGIDSSIVVAAMSDMLDAPVKTFSIGFADEEYNELPFARSIAKQYATEHREFVVRPDIVESLPRIVQYYGEPFADSSAVPTFYLAQKTSEHVTVALTGDGGDEGFAGYERYSAMKRTAFLKRLLACTPIAALGKRLPNGAGRNSFIARVKRFLRALEQPPEQRYVRWLCHFDNDMKNSLYTTSFMSRIRESDSVDFIVELFKKALADSALDRILSVDTMSYLPEALMVKTDIATMAHSLEARSPFLDHTVMEFAATLPPEYKLRGFTTKYFLRRLSADYLPAGIADRKKMGFGVPIDRWLRTDLKEMVYDVLLDSRAIQRGYFNKKFLQEMINEHMTKTYDHCYRIWNLLVLELWHRIYYDNRSTHP